MTDVVLVKCWKGNSRGLPKGKINQGEPAIDAALREVRGRSCLVHAHVLRFMFLISRPRSLYALPGFVSCTCCVENNRIKI